MDGHTCIWLVAMIICSVSVKCNCKPLLPLYRSDVTPVWKRSSAITGLMYYLGTYHKWTTNKYTNKICAFQFPPTVLQLNHTSYLNKQNHFTFYCHYYMIGHTNGHSWISRLRIKHSIFKAGRQSSPMPNSSTVLSCHVLILHCCL